MTDERVKQAQEALTLLDGAAANVNTNRQSHVNIQLAVQLLSEFLNEAAENSKPASEATPENVVMLPPKR